MDWCDSPNPQSCGLLGHDQFPQQLINQAKLNSLSKGKYTSLCIFCLTANWLSISIIGSLHLSICWNVLFVSICHIHSSGLRQYLNSFQTALPWFPWSTAGLDDCSPGTSEPPGPYHCHLIARDHCGQESCMACAKNKLALALHYTMHRSAFFVKVLKEAPQTWLMKATQEILNKDWT